MRNKSLYDILGVARGATLGEIKAAFRRQARDSHPDTGSDDAAAERFKDLSRAYAILADERERQRYDRGDIDESGASTARPGRQRPGYGKKQAGKHARAGTTAGSSAKRDKIMIVGADVSYTLRVGALDAAKGARRRIETTNGKSLNVSIPSGTRNGQVLRLKGQGMAGIGGGRDGDALIEILVDGRDAFRIDGSDTHLDLPISLKEAVQGATVEVPGLDGMLKVKVPPGSNSGDVLRLAGKGLERAGGERGDQLVRVIVTLPAKADSALNSFVRDWSPQAPFTARKHMKSGNDD